MTDTSENITFSQLHWRAVKSEVSPLCSPITHPILISHYLGVISLVNKSILSTPRKEEALSRNSQTAFQKSLCNKRTAVNPLLLQEDEVTDPDINGAGQGGRGGATTHCTGPQG